MKTLYTAKVHVSGGRGHGKARSSDGHLDITLSTPGTGGKGTNPEQLLAAGWSACFEDAIGIAAYVKTVALPFNRSIETEVDLLSEKSDFSLQARMKISIPGLQKSVALQLVEEARRICPYTKALEGKIPVEFILI
jgi:lipoyl-dependent peroxiredoxin